MVIKTIAVWGRLVDEDEGKPLFDKLKQYIDNGQCLHAATEINHNGHRGFERTWTDLASAEEFTTFIKTFVPPPIVAEVEHSE